MIANKYTIRSGIGRSTKYLSSFDKALIDAGVGNYNLVRLSSILPAECQKCGDIDIPEGSLLPTAFATITSDICGDNIVSGVAIGVPSDKSKVCIIMEYSESDSENVPDVHVQEVLSEMVKEAFEARGWEWERIDYKIVGATVGENETVTTFACVSEWW